MGNSEKNQTWRTGTLCPDQSAKEVDFWLFSEEGHCWTIFWEYSSDEVITVKTQNQKQGFGMHWLSYAADNISTQSWPFCAPQPHCQSHDLPWPSSLTRNVYSSVMLTPKLVTAAQWKKKKIRLKCKYLLFVAFSAVHSIIWTQKTKRNVHYVWDPLWEQVYWHIFYYRVIFLILQWIKKNRFKKSTTTKHTHTKSNMHHVRYPLWAWVYWHRYILLLC